MLPLLFDGHGGLVILNYAFVDWNVGNDVTPLPSSLGIAKVGSCSVL